MKTQYQDLFAFLKKKYPGARTGLFTNHVSFDFQEKKYLSQLLEEKYGLKRILVPEHGYFSEWQDQQPVRDTDMYWFLSEKAEYVILYGGSRKSPVPYTAALKDLDLLIIELQDIGSRYYTYITMVAGLLGAVADQDPIPDVILLDRPNPAGRQVEGTPLQSGYGSLIGWPGLPQRYGLTIGELCNYLYGKSEWAFNFKIFPYDAADRFTTTIRINSSPNIPRKDTIHVFHGQCLWEGTNVSEGRGTTRPFEIFGAPYFKDISSTWIEKWNEKNKEAVLRPLVFVPAFHKYASETCYGFQLHPVNYAYHSLYYTLKLIRHLRELLPAMQWKPGPYEKGSEKTAIELLAGDTFILDYLNGKLSEKILREGMYSAEKKWILETREHLLYQKNLSQAI